jgi:hypothetical protein
MECWSNGVLLLRLSSLHYSNTPLLQRELIERPVAVEHRLESLSSWTCALLAQSVHYRLHPLLHLEQLRPGSMIIFAR